MHVHVAEPEQFELPTDINIGVYDLRLVALPASQLRPISAGPLVGLLLLLTGTFSHAHFMISPFATLDPYNNSPVSG